MVRVVCLECVFRGATPRLPSPPKHWVAESGRTVAGSWVQVSRQEGGTAAEKRGRAYFDRLVKSPLSWRRVLVRLRLGGGPAP